jgi:hypothetical protein
MEDCTACRRPGGRGENRRRARPHAWRRAIESRGRWGAIIGRCMAIAQRELQGRASKKTGVLQGSYRARQRLCGVLLLLVGVVGAVGSSRGGGEVKYPPTRV